MFKNIEKFCNISGVSGFEQDVRNEIINQIEKYVTYSIDNLGNIIAFKKGREIPKNKIMISAHMDEVGMIIRYIRDDGLICVNFVGGIDPNVVVGRSVIVGENKITGVIGTKAIHMVKSEEKLKGIDIDSIYVDIGATSKKDAEKYISIGEQISFKSEYKEYGDGFIRSKALDDRFGCSVMIEMIKKDLEYDSYFTFVVQEEVGLRGAKVAAYSVGPDIAIVLESTTACDFSGVPEDKKVCILGDGPVISFMDNSTIYNKDLYNIAFNLAKENNIKCQTKTMVAGGNDSGAIHISKSGVKTLSISIPCRYLHTANTVAKKEDILNSLALAEKVFVKFANI